MNRHYKKQILFGFLILNFLATFSQTKIFQDKFSKLFECSINSIININFKEYYEINILQTLDHSDPKDKFTQRIYFGFYDFDAPTIFMTDGYSIDYASKADYSNELAKKFEANILIVEHRFFGKSIPKSIDWNLLTMKQAAQDYHIIKSMFDKLLTGKWISTGVSKGGQAALFYKVLYPKDVSATIVYGTAIKNKKTMYMDTILSSLSQADCGKKIDGLQIYLFKNKSILLPLFSSFVYQKNYNFTPFDNETVLDYLLLELPFSFWQNGNKCVDIPDTASTSGDLIDYLIKVVPPQFFSSDNKKQLESAFYMFYHELGYYEYNIKPFIKYLKQNDYSNSYFTPQSATIKFDSSFYQMVNAFMSSNNSKSIFFIYGQNDPWALQTTITKNVYFAPNGSHKSRIADLSTEQQSEIFNKIGAFIK